MDTLGDLHKSFKKEDKEFNESLHKKKVELSHCIDKTIERGNVDQDVLNMMKEMLLNLKPVNTMEEFIDDYE